MFIGPWCERLIWPRQLDGEQSGSSRKDLACDPEGMPRHAAEVAWRTATHARYGMVNGPCGRTAMRAWPFSECEISLTAAPMSWQGARWAVRIVSSESEL